MKTNEFIKELEAMGFEVEEYTGYLDVYCDDYLIMKVETENIFSVNTQHIGFDKLEETKKQQLFKLLTEYASTPIEEREEDKKYRYYQKSIDGMEVVVKRKCWNFNECNNHWFLDSEFEVGSIKTSFTHLWLKERGIDIEQLQEKYEEVEAKE